MYLQPSLDGEPTATPAALSESPPASHSVANVSVQATSEAASSTEESFSTCVEEEVVVHSPSSSKDVSMHYIFYFHCSIQFGFLFYFASYILSCWKYMYDTV